MNKIKIFDTTLRDGEQSPGASMNIAEKIQIARQLEKMGVDTIEAGFPVASQGDFEAVKRVASEIKKSSVCGLARAVEGDIKRCWDAVKSARKPKIHTFIATSSIHRKSKLGMTKKEVIQNAVKAVKKACSFCKDVEFSAEDATRTDPEYLIEVVRAAADAGAKTINIPDTVGYALPAEFGELIKRIRNSLPEDVVLSVHCHNDLGLASANSLEAVSSGASQIECTVNGIGERAGNAAMEEVIMALKVRKDIFGEISMDIDTRQIFPTSSLVARLSGMQVQRNKAVVGANAFRHEAGIHQHGVIKDKLTYEIMTPESVGSKVEALYLGKHSGRHAIKERLERMGVDAGKIDIEDLFERFKKLADKKKQVYDDEILTLVEDQIGSVRKIYELDYIHTLSGTKTVPSATIRIKINKSGKKSRVIQEAAVGDGPVDACYNAINKVTGIVPVLVDYNIKAVSRGGDSLGEVTIRIKEKEASGEIQGRGSSTDIIEASALAYISAINRLKVLKSGKGGGRLRANL